MFLALAYLDFISIVSGLVVIGIGLIVWYIHENPQRSVKVKFKNLFGRNKTDL